MSFLHPWALAIGALAAALPVIVHWLTRPRPVRMPLSTIRFVREVVRQRRARHRLRDFLVLLLRTAAILLVACALARPQWGTQPLVSDDSDSGDAVRVVVLDASQSMAAIDGGAELFERARTTANGYLRYRPGLRVNLIVAGATPRAVFDQPSTNSEALRDELRRAQALPEGFDVRRALETAAQMLAPSGDNDTRRRELVVISDFQRRNWSQADFSVLPADTQIELEPVRSAAPADNIAVLRAECIGRNTQGRAARLEVDVGNFTRAAREVTVEVNLGDASYRVRGDCPAGRVTTLSDEILPRDVGWRWGEARIVGADDALSADDARPVVVQVRPRPLYALVTRQPSTQRPSSSHFLECALVPDVELRERASARLVRLNPANLDRESLAPADLIALDHPGKL
ncbi:MAG: BatA and WFA domain-containing protein, partial [Pirellulales bacterium]